MAIKGPADIKKRAAAMLTVMAIGAVAAGIYYFRRTVKRAFLAMLSLPLPYLLLIVFIFILLLLIIALLVLRSARKKAPEPDKPEAEKAGAEEEKPPVQTGRRTAYSALKMRKIFSRAMALLRTSVTGRNYRYQIPWFLMIGEAGAGKTSALEKSGLNLPLGDPVGGRPGERDECKWWFFEKGAIVDVSGDFIVRADGTTSEERMWRLLLRLFQKHRPKRPADGIVLAIPASEFLPGPGEDEPDLDRISKKADRIYQKLWEAQKVLGMRLPVYILVTQCDRLTGFSHFCRELPGRLAAGMFGWSSPYAVDKSYTSEWVDEAFESIERDLHQVQFELFTEGTEATDRDGLYLFPERLRRLVDPIRIGLDRIFRQSAYHEPFLFRGLYFTGQATLPGAKQEKPRHFFLKELFEKKIFPEFQLARPIRKTLISRNRTVFGFQVAALLFVVIFGLGFWGAYRQLKVDKTALMPVLEKIGEDVGQLKEKDVEGSSLGLFQLLHERSARVPFKESALHLFKGMTNVRRLTYVFIPSSWFSNIHEDIRKTMVLAYDEIILKTLYLEFFQKAKNIFDTSGRPVSDSMPPTKVLAPQQTPEFVQLKKFVEDIRKLERYAKMYNGLRSSKNLEDLGRVVKYLYNIDLPPAFFKNAQYYHDALGETEYRIFDPTIFKLKARMFTVRELSKSFFDRVFARNPLLLQLEALSRELEGYKEKTKNVSQSLEDIKRILAMLEQTRKMLADPDLQWVFEKPFDLGEQWDNLLVQIGNSDFLGPEIRKDGQEAANKAFQRLREQIAQQGSYITGKLLDRKEDGTLKGELSPDVLELEKDLKLLLAQEFIVQEPKGEIDISFPPNSRLRWDDRVLKDAVAVFGPYESFRKDKLAAFPAQVHDILTEVAKASLESKIQELIVRAQHFEPIAESATGSLREMDVVAELRNFKKSSDSLGRLLTYCQQYDLLDSENVLTNLLYWQMATLLEAIDDLLDSEDLYTVRGGDFSWWDGKEPLSLAAFSVVDEKELENYLRIQRERISHVALEYARPLVSFLETHYLLRQEQEQRILFRWKRIISQLEKYANKKPDNSVTVLENFIQFDMDKIEPANYKEKISKKELEDRSGDFFLQVRNSLRRKLYKRCRQINQAHVAADYAALQGFFNEKLAGRYPFADRHGRAEYIAADPDDIRDFFKIYDRQAEKIEPVLKDSRGFGISADHALIFIEAMGRVKDFFSTFITGEGKEKVKPAAPLFGFRFQFRVNRENEKGANKIIEWTLKVADQVFHYGSKSDTGQWQYKDPITLSLRWAKDATVYPVGDGAARIENGTAAFSFNDPWSLIRMLQDHAAAPGDFGGVPDPKPYTLKFEVEARTKNPDGAGDANFVTRVYDRIALFSPDKTGNTLTLPVFPRKAPDLQKTKEAD